MNPRVIGQRQLTSATRATYDDDAHPIGVAQKDFPPFGNVFGLYFVFAVFLPQTCHLCGREALGSCHQKDTVLVNSDCEFGSTRAMSRLNACKHRLTRYHMQHMLMGVAAGSWLFRLKVQKVLGLWDS